MEKSYFLEICLKIIDILKERGEFKPYNILLQLLALKQIAEKQTHETFSTLNNENIYSHIKKVESEYPDIFDIQFTKHVFNATKPSIIEILGNINISTLPLKEKFDTIQNIIQYSSMKGEIISSNKLLDALLSIQEFSYNQKILEPEAKSGEILLNVLKNLVFKYPDHIDEIFSNILANEPIKENVSNIKLASFLLFGRIINVKSAKFIDSEGKTFFDTAIANPRFGRPAIPRQNTEQYELAYKWVKADDDLWEKTSITKNYTPDEVLVLEKMFSGLKPEGTMTIFLPNAIMENAVHEYVRFWLKRNTEIEHIISLYAGVFKPYTNVKTCIIKLKKSSSPIKNYSVKLSIIKNEEELTANVFNNKYFEVPIEKLSIDNFTPEFYAKESDDFTRVLDISDNRLINEIAEILSTKAAILKQKEGNIKYIDISCVEASTGEIKEVKQFNVNEVPKRAYYQVKTGDVITAVSGGGIGTKSHSSAVIAEEFDGCICSNGFKVLRTKNDINSYYLWYFLRSDYFLQQVKRLSVGSTTIPNIKDKDFQSIKIFLPPLHIQNEIAEKVKYYLKILKEAQLVLNNPEQKILNLTKGENLLW